MVTVLMWIGIVVGALVALLLLVLATILLVPIELEGCWTEARRGGGVAGPGVRVTYEGAEGAIELRLLAWRVRRWQVAGRPRDERRRRRPRRRRTPRGSRTRLSPRRLWRERRRVVSALRAFLRRLRVRRLSVGAVIASPDPAWTGWASAVAYAGWGALPARFQPGVRVRSDFVAEAPSLEGELRVRMQPWIVAALALRLWGVVRRSRRRRPNTDGGRKPARAADGRSDAS